MGYEKQKRRVRKIYNKWAEDLGLGWWHVDFFWEYDSSLFSNRDGYSGIAYVTARWEYRMAGIHFNMHMLESRSDEDLEKDVLHEMVHIPLFEMEGKGKHFEKHRERVVESLMNAFKWTRQGGFKAGVRHEKRRRKKEEKRERNK